MHNSFKVHTDCLSLGKNKLRCSSIHAEKLVCFMIISLGIENSFSWINLVFLSLLIKKEKKRLKVQWKPLLLQLFVNRFCLAVLVNSFANSSVVQSASYTFLLYSSFLSTLPPLAFLSFFPLSLPTLPLNSLFLKFLIEGEVGERKGRKNKKGKELHITLQQRHLLIPIYPCATPNFPASLQLGQEAYD